MQKSRLFRSKKHLRWVAEHRCIAETGGALVHVGYPVSQAAHLRPYAPCGIGQKPSDHMVVSLCPPHHDEFDGRIKGLQGKAFFEARGIDPVEIAGKLMEARNV